MNGGVKMSAGAIIMMIIGLGTVWGGVLVTILIALAVEKKNKLKGENGK
jgi:hypothetical protein